MEMEARNVGLVGKEDLGKLRFDLTRYMLGDGLVPMLAATGMKQLLGEEALALAVLVG
jgi:hypothetical protein